MSVYKIILSLFAIFPIFVCHGQPKEYTGIPCIDEKLKLIYFVDIMSVNTSVSIANIQLYSDVIALMHKYDITNALYYNILGRRARAYFKLERYEKSFADYIVLRDYYQASNNYSDLLYTYKALCIISYLQEDYTQGLLYAQEAYQMSIESTDGQIVLEGKKLLRDALYYHGDNYEECVQVCQEILHIYKNRLNISDNDIYDIYETIAKLTDVCAFNIEETVTTLIKLENKANDPWLKSVICYDLASYYYNTSNFDLAIDYYNKIITLYEQYYKGIDNHTISEGLYEIFKIYTNTLLDLCGIYYSKAQYPEAEQYIMQIRDVYENENNSDLRQVLLKLSDEYVHEIYTTALIFHLNILNEKKHHENILVDLEKIAILFSKVIISDFETVIAQLPYMCKQERAWYIEYYSNFVNEVFQILACYPIKEFSPMFNVAYDTQLFYKGLLLMMDVLIGEDAMTETNQVAIDIPRVEDIKNKLFKTSVAIEFVSFPTSGSKDYEYAALILRKDWDSPKMISLCSKEELEQVSRINLEDEKWRKNSFARKDLDKRYFKKGYSLIWSKLEPYINEGDNVYFSPSGLLHQINMEVLKDSIGRQANEKYNLYRVSSTRQLCIEKPKVRYTNATLYGGLIYEMDSTQMIAQSRTYHSTDDYVASRGFVADSTMRVGWNYLPATKSEVEMIARQMYEHGIHPERYTETVGTEESFKALSGKQIPIIHLATHGFFLKDEEARKQDYFQALNLELSKNIEDNSLKRSGLILSGGQRAWLNQPIPANVEDGILLAEEIATMDLSGTDLVVLSACQTGLGEITSEGVFGLQRAFKNAGVQTLIMSLWRVNDAATSLMMQTFYEHLLSGQSKREAFAIAQQAVKEKYNDPYYWAAFIMLD